MKNVKEVYDFLKSCGTFYVASTDENHEPHVRPFGVVMLDNGRLYVNTDIQKKCYRQMVENRRIEITGTVFSPEVRWIRLTAFCKAAPDPALKEKMFLENPVLQGMYAGGNETSIVVELYDMAASVFSFDGAPREIE